MQSSEGMIKFIRALEVAIRIQGRIDKSFVNAYLKCDNIPILWKKHYSKIVHDKCCKHNQNCSESRFLDFTKCNGCF